MPKVVVVRAVENFRRNLEEIENFLDSSEPGSFGALVERLLDEVIPNLKQFPLLGALFLARKPKSAKGVAVHRRLAKRAKGQRVTLREYIFDSYICLYAERTVEVYLLTIRHHRQLSFDFSEHWSMP